MMKVIALSWFFTSVFVNIVIIEGNDFQSLSKDKSQHRLSPKQQQLLPQSYVGIRRSTFRTVDLLNIKNRITLKTTTSHLNIDDDDEKDDDDVQELYFTQLLDHYQGHQNMTFQQRYFRSDRFMRHTTTTTTVPKDLSVLRGGGGGGGKFHDDNDDDTEIITIVLICVGGEGPSFDRSVLRDSVHCTGDMIESAQLLYNTYPHWSIVLIAFEHRYYGTSYPTFPIPSNTNHNSINTPHETSPVTNENLIYLSSRQATADLAHFIHTMFHQKPSNHLVYLFGGSYPGMMAAYTRTKYPYLIQGAISNSAPVQAVLNFDTYQSHVGYNLQQIDMNCYNIVTMGHLAITKILEQNVTNKIQSLAKHFNLCNSDVVLLSKENQNLFVGDGVIYFGAQENDPHCKNNNDPLNFCNMEQKCNALTTQYTKEMNDTNTSIEIAAINALAYLARIQQQSLRMSQSSADDGIDDGDDDHCFVVDWDETLKFIADPILGQADGLRSWLYQTCTEFGFYQTCYDHKCPFGIGYHTLQQDLYICQYAFNVYNTVQAVQNTNEWTGGWENIEQTSRIFSVIGTVDPWSEMAIQHTSSPSFTAQHRDRNPNDYPLPYQVHGASHHFWTHPSKTTDDDAIKAARQKIYQTLHDWIMSDIEKFDQKRAATIAQR